MIRSLNIENTEKYVQLAAKLLRRGRPSCFSGGKMQPDSLYGQYA